MQSPHEEAKRWRYSLKTGDEAMLPNGMIANVVRHTTTQVMFCVHGRELKFNRERGREVGSSSYSAIQQVTPRLRQQVADKSLRKRLDDEVCWKPSTLTIDEVAAIMGALDAHRAAKAAEQESKA